MWLQREITLGARPRGFHLVTREVLDALPELSAIQVGLLHILIRHTSASLALGENASPAVRRRSEERRVGKECSSPCRSRWSPYH